MSRTSNDAAKLSSATIGALVDPDLVSHLAGTLPPNLPAELSVSLVRRIAAGVPTELHVDAGAVHGFDRIAPDAAISRVARTRRARFLRRHLDQPHSNGAQ